MAVIRNLARARSPSSVSISQRFSASSKTADLMRLLNWISLRRSNLHEGAASFACSAYGKLPGRLAACFSIAGPGATNLLTGLWDANVDRAPVLALTGQIDTQVLGTGAFQEVDLQAAYGKVAQWTQPALHTYPFRLRRIPDIPGPEVGPVRTGISDAIDDS